MGQLAGTIAWGAILTALVGWVVLAALVLPGVARRALGRDPSLAWMVAAWFGLALSLRLLLPPLAPFHENQHGFSVLSGDPFFHQIRTSYLEALRLLQVRLHGVLLLNTVLSALTCAWLGLAAQVLWGRRATAWFAGLAAALLPLAVRLGASEVEFNTGAFFLSLALWLGLEATRPSEARLEVLGLAALSMALAAQVSVTTVTWPLAWAGLLALTMGARRLRGATLALLVAPLLASLLHGLAILAVPEADAGRHGYLQFFWPGALTGLACYPEPVPPLFSAAAALGLGLSLAAPGERRRGLAWLVCAAVLQASAAPVFGTLGFAATPSVFRLDLAATLLWALPAGRALDRLAAWGWRLGASWGPRAALALLSVGVAAASLPSLAWITHRYPDNLQYEFLRTSAADLPERATLVTWERQRKATAITSTGWLQAVKPGWRVLESSRLDQAATSPRPLLLLLDLHCSLRATRGEEEAGPVPTRYGPLAPECAAALQARPWQEVARLDLPAEPYLGYDLAPIGANHPLVWLSSSQ
jgi:hypothetical protein